MLNYLIPSENNTWRHMKNNLKDFAIFILTHGRPDNVITKKTLDSCGYTGSIYFIVDNKDDSIDKYIANFGKENVIVFDKKAMSKSIDNFDNFSNLKAIVHARNACFDVAKKLGIKHFMQLDDDYYYFGYRDAEGAVKCKNIDSVICSMIEFLDATPTSTIAFSQGGDHIGGFSGVKLKRKAMNSFICSTDKPFNFIGTINEDVNTYTTLGSRGCLFFTFTGFQLDQKDTQSQKSGITDTYRLQGTYVKSFYTVMTMPSSVKVSMMNSRNTPRLHHTIKWNNTTPLIISEKYKKN